MASGDRRHFADQSVRLLIPDKSGIELQEVKFRSDIDAYLDTGYRAVGIPDRWRGRVAWEGRTYVVGLFGDEWFFGDTIPDDDGENDPAPQEKGK